MIDILGRWFHRYFSDPQAVLLVILLIFGVTVLMTMGEMLAPVLASMVLAYLLEGLVNNLQYWRIRRFPAVLIVFLGFITFLLFIIFVLTPLVYNQLSQLLQEFPTMIAHGRSILIQLPQEYPDFISVKQIENLITAIKSAVGGVGHTLVSYSLASIPAIITVLVYAILVPLLIFFFLKDKKILLNWFTNFLPKERTAANVVWKEVDAQMGNYIRGKVYEIFIISVFTYIPFALMGLNYASLLAVLVGLSVIIPYIGAAVVTIPVILVAYFQWGTGNDFMAVMIAYGIVQAFDGNVLVPLLFSEAVNLHPVAIILAVLVFGGLWGFWGVFFAIPLATLVKALLNAWPRAPMHEVRED